MIASLPVNEDERLRTLRRYSIMDTAPEAAFDRLTTLAARLLDVPVALLSLVDANRQWFKACYGTDLRETTREVSFCAHAILADEMMIIPDATRDPRFLDNPLVTGAPSIRFYAGVPLKVANGANIGTLCIIDLKPRELSASQQSLFQDLAEIAMDELRLRLSMIEKIQLAAAIDHVDRGVLVTDPNQPDNPIIYSNPAFTEITGYARSEIAGENCRFLNGAETEPGEIAKIREALRERRLYEGLILNYRKEGKPFWNDLTISPVFDEEKRLISFVGLQSDVTERREAEIALQESYEKLKELEGQRDNLTHMIVHDLRSPLTVMTGFLGILEIRTEGKLDEDEAQSLHFVREACKKLNTMITSLLDVSRLEAGQMPMELVECDLVELTRESLHDSVALEGAERLQLDLPAAPVPVFCDRSLTTRVIGNLTGNALKFTPAPGEVRVRVEATDAGARLAVSDQGPGIPPDSYESIFAKFGQVKGSQKEHSTGLGLNFCKLAIEGQGGVIGVESELGAGSTFSFTLPKPAI